MIASLRVALNDHAFITDGMKGGGWHAPASAALFNIPSAAMPFPNDYTLNPSSADTVDYGCHCRGATRSHDRALVDSASMKTGRGKPTVRVVRKQAPLDQRALVLALASLRARESPAEPRSSETGIRRGTKTSNTAIDESNTTATNAIEPGNSSEDMFTSSGRETRCVETSRARV
jgi:hypothetical protein